MLTPSEMTAAGQEFSDETYLPASEKRLIFASWNAFLRHGCQLGHFTQRLYKHLIQNCSFMAHYDLRGFYSVYFDPGSRNTQRFFDQFDPAKPGFSAEIGDCFWISHITGADLNRAMRESAGAHVERLRFQFSEAERVTDLRYAALLAAKWGKQLVDAVPIPAGEPPQITISAGSPTQLGMFGTPE